MGWSRSFLGVYVCHHDKLSSNNVSVQIFKCRRIKAARRCAPDDVDDDDDGFFGPALPPGYQSCSPER